MMCEIYWPMKFLENWINVKYIDQLLDNLIFCQIYWPMKMLENLIFCQIYWPLQFPIAWKLKTNNN